MIHEPTAFKIARIFVVLVLLGTFGAFTALNIMRFIEPPTTQQSVIGFDDSPRLPDFVVEPVNNRTMLSSFNCTYDMMDDDDFGWPMPDLQVVPQLVPPKRQLRSTGRALFLKLQSLIPGSKDMPDYEVVNKVQSGMYDIQSKLTSQEWAFLDSHPAYVRNKETPMWFQQSLPRERWTVYKVPQLTNGRYRDSLVLQMTCRIGNMSEITVADEFATTPNTTRLLNGNSSIAMANFARQPTDALYSSQPFDGVPLFRGQRTMLTYARRDDCKEIFMCKYGVLCWFWTQCKHDYELKLMNNVPVADGSALPIRFQNATGVDSYAYVTVQLAGRESGPGGVPVTVVTLKRTYGILEILASLFSLLSVLLLLYKRLMGDFKLNPFGWVQSQLLKHITKDFVKEVKHKKDDDEWLEHVLFTLYVSGNGLYEEQGTMSKMKQALRNVRNKARRRWSDVGHAMHARTADQVQKLGLGV